MARDGRSGDDDPETLLFGDDNFDEEPDEEPGPTKPEPRQRSLWRDLPQDDEERAPTQPVASPVDDLRYQGPISMEDSDDPEEPYEDSGPGTGRMFFAAALIGGVIITMFAVALYYRGTGDEIVTATVAKSAAERRPIASSASNSAGTTAPPSAKPSTTIPTAPASGYRAAPEIPPPTAPASRPQQQAEATTPSAPERPRAAPVGASGLRPAVTAEGNEPDSASSSPALREIARRGRSRLAAAPSGSWTLQVIVACQPANVEKAFRSVDSANLVAIPVDLKGQACYRLCWGVYPDRTAAERALSDVPQYFAQDTSPRPVAVSTVVGR